jgi:hypothetical protein
MSWSFSQITAIYSESAGAGTLALSGYTTNTDLLFYTTLKGYTTTGTSGVTSPTSWFITWDQTTSTTGYANGVAPSVPSEIYINQYPTSSTSTNNDIYNFVLKPNGIWTLTFVKASTTTTHPVSVFFVGYDNVNNLTYTKQVALTL